MKPAFLIALTALLIGPFVAMCRGQVGGFREIAVTDKDLIAAADSPKPFPGKVSKWNGFTRHDFQVDGANVIVVEPAKPLAEPSLSNA